MVYNGYGRIMRLVYIMFDGDIIFIMLINKVKVDVIIVGMFVVNVMEKVILRGIRFV